MILLTSDHIDVFDPVTEPDGHGWATPTDPVLVWSGDGAFQESAPAADRARTDAGGDGPLAPAHRRQATAYLPPDAVVAPGHLLAVRGEQWVVGRVRPIPDPTNSGIGALVCDVDEVSAR